MLEAGYLKDIKEDGRAGLVVSEGARKKTKPDKKALIYKKLKAQCGGLIELIDELNS
jgi:hypothetical protein